MDRESAGSIPFRSFMPLPHHLPQFGPHCRRTPNRAWVPLGVELLPSPSHPSGMPVLEVWPFLLLPLPSLPLPQDPCGWRGPRWAEDQAGDLSRFLGAQVGRGNLATLPLEPLPSQCSPVSHFGHGIPSPPPATPRAPLPSRLHFSSPCTPPTPHVLPGRWGFPPSP